MRLVSTRVVASNSNNVLLPKRFFFIVELYKSDDVSEAGRAARNFQTRFGTNVDSVLVCQDGSRSECFPCLCSSNYRHIEPVG